MSIYEYDEEAVKKVWQDEAYVEGRQEGYGEGHQEGYDEGHQEGYDEGITLMNQLNQRLIEENRIEDMKRVISDKAFREQLLREMKLQSK